MAHGSSVRAENLIYTLKELQNEKVCLEQKLQEQEQTKRSLEHDLDQETNKCAHAREKHRRMAGTFAVAQQKVDMTLSTCLSLQEEIAQRKPQLQKTQQAIEDNKKLQQKNIHEFEKALSILSAELFHARDFYKKTALRYEINNAFKAMKELNLKAERDCKEPLCRKLEHLKQEKYRCSTSKYGCEGILYACYCAMERDRQEAEEYRNRVRAELKEIQDVLNAKS